MHFVPVEEGVQLEVLDWGGAGRPVVLLTGSGTTASPAIYAAVVLLFLLVTLAAASIPVRRASRLDPAVALRSE